MGFAVTLPTPRYKSSGKSVSRVVPYDIDFSSQKIGKGAFARTVSIVYSQLKYWWRYAKWRFNNKVWFYKSQKELGEELGMSEKTIWRCIKRLKELGLILVEKHHRQYWKQVYFYHMCFIPAVKSGDGASLPVSNPTPTTATSKQTDRPTPSRQNDGIKHKKTNPLEEIIKRATQHRPTGKGFGGDTNIAGNNNHHTCRYCRGSGLVDNDKNIAIACECEAGSKYRHIAPSFRDAEILISAA